MASNSRSAQLNCPEMGRLLASTRISFNSASVSEDITVAAFNRIDKRELRTLVSRSLGPVTKGVAFSPFVGEIEASLL